MRHFFLLIFFWITLASLSLSQTCDGGRITLTTGDTVAIACVQDGMADLVSFQTTSTDTGYAYILTDDQNIIINEVVGQLDIDPLAGFNFRIWGVSFTGNKRITPGFSIFSLPVATGCQDFSDNFIPIQGAFVDGGVVASRRGLFRLEYCVGDGLVDLLFMQNVTPSTESYVYILTDANDNYIRTLSGNVIDFENEGPGVVHIHGLSYTGTLTPVVGQPIDSTVLSTGCYSLSSNFVTVIKTSADAGKVFTAAGDSVITICVDGNADNVTFTNTVGAISPNYTYILTTPGGVILVPLASNSIDLDASGVGNYRMYGVSHQGVLNAQPGQSLSSLSTNCLAISDNFVTINAILPPLAGRVSFANGDTTADVCVGDGKADLLIMVTSAVDTPYAFVLTDTRDQVLTVLPGTQVTADFDLITTPDTCRVYGVAYVGQIAFVPGQSLASGIATGCTSISDNYLLVTKVSPDGGRAFALPGVFAVDICLGSDDARVGFGSISSSNLNYGFILVDNNNVVLGYSSNDTIDFAQYPSGSYRVRGISYRGSLNNVTGQRIDTANHATDCFQLSSNPVTVSTAFVDGGTLSGVPSDTILVCPGDGRPDAWGVTLTQQANDGSNVLVLTDTNLVVRYVTNTPQDLEPDTLQGYPFLVWNLNYTGNLLAALGDTATQVELSDGCFALSNPIALEAARPDGGRVAASPGGFQVDVCVGGLSSNLDFITANTAPGLNYAYVVTDNQNVILGTSLSATIDFLAYEASFGLGSYRVWGLSYSGNLGNVLTQRADTALLSDGCFALSSNFVEVTTIPADGGLLSSPAGDPITVCPGDGLADTFAINVNQLVTGSKYAYLITDAQNTIVAVSTTWPVDFDGLSGFPLRVWGLGYQDTLLAQPGQQAATARLASGCFNLSFNFLTVEGASTDGGRVFTSTLDLSLEFCKDGKADEVIFRTTSPSASKYAFFLTDPALNVLEILPDSTYNFDTTLAGTYRVYGVSYEGSIPVKVGQNIARGLGPGCYSLSSNFVEILLREDCIIEVCFLDDFQPGNSQAWAVWLKGIWGTPGYNYTFGRNSGMLIIYGDGTARIVGRIFNKADARYQWDVDVSLVNKRDWAAWSALGRGYASSNKPFAVSNHPFWDYWEMDPTAQNTLKGVTGTRLQGKVLYLTHRPSNLSKGFQKGQGANDKNANFGFSGWFYFTGSYSGIGDFNNTIRCDNSDFAIRTAENYLNGLAGGKGDLSGGSGGKMSPIMEKGRAFEVYPTPFVRDIQLRSPETGTYRIKVYQLDGKEVMNTSLRLEQGANTLNLSALPKGAFILWIENESGQRESHRILKQ